MRFPEDFLSLLVFLLLLSPPPPANTTLLVVKAEMKISTTPRGERMRMRREITFGRRQAEVLSCLSPVFRRHTTPRVKEGWEPFQRDWIPEFTNLLTFYIFSSFSPSPSSTSLSQ